MKTLYNKWIKANYQAPEVTYKVHFKRTKTIEAKIRRYDKNNTSYYLTTNALEYMKIKWIAKGNNFTYEGMDERVFGDDEELFINSNGWVIQNGKFLNYPNGKNVHIRNMIPKIWVIKKRK